ncbi:ribonucleoside-diphosphate reductase subunit alpha, partial [Virgibacillus halodenitrificans]|nr:ribonucleoside-diphosphate reductase subunit alpha [Virgibacillus halodenitrificans]
MITKNLDYEEKVMEWINRAAKELPINTEKYIEKSLRAIQEDTSLEKITDILVKNALENIDESAPEWTFLASRIFLEELYRQAAKNRDFDVNLRYGNFYKLISTLTEQGIYATNLLNKYNEEEIEAFEKQLDPQRDLLFNYLGIHTIASRYLATDHNKNVMELPQERWMIIAMYLMQDEDKAQRAQLVQEAYWALSNLYMTVATPTLTNAGKTHGQLSSCFIDTVDDSLQSIYDSNTDIAKLSKNGGGIGVYMGKIRSRGSAIKGFKGMSSGVVPWIKQLNNTAVNVDQLGTRKGAIAIYLDAWHKDIEAFLDLKLNNGDDRMRAHDIFTGVCLPDYFMEQVDKRGDWYLFDPHEVRQVMGFSLEDFYDEEKGSG